jgi:quercetin dioxygenase-like cupin family protein
MARLGRAFCFPPQTVHWWQALPPAIVDVPALGSLAVSGVGL